MTQDIDGNIQRSRRYWFDDGLAEIAIGVVFLALGGLFLTEAFRLIPSGASSIGLIVIVFAGWWLGGLAVRALKNRLTYPRTGYVRYPRGTRPRRRLIMAVVVAAVMAGAVAVAVVLAPASLAWLPTLDGVLVAAFFLYVAFTVGVSRFYLLALLSVSIGLAASLSRLGDSLGTGVLYGGVGVGLVISGVAVLVVYLRNTQPPEGEQP